MTVLRSKPHTVPDGADWALPPVRWLFAGTEIVSPGRRPGLDGTGSWQCRPKAGTGTGLGLDLMLRTTSEDRNRRRNLIFTCVSPFLSMGIWYQLLIEVFQAEIPLFGPILTSVFALYLWIRLGLAGTGTGSAGRRPGLDGTGSWQCHPRTGTGTRAERR